MINVDGQNLENIKEKITKTEPVKFTGNIGFNTNLSSISGTENRTSPWAYGLTSRMRLSLYGINIPFYFSFRNHSFHYGSSLPKFRFRPSYKWAEMQIGDVFTKFNEYTLFQRNIRGVSLRLTPKKFRFEVLSGRMKDYRSYQDTLLLGTVADDTYSRRVMGASVGIGTRINHFDIYALKAFDNQDSIYYLERNLPQQDNVIGGASLRLKLLKRLFFESNIGLSVLTYDQNALGEENEIGRNGLTNNVLIANGSTSAKYAGDVKVSYSSRFIGLHGKVRYLQSGYQPLTVPYIQTDLIDYTIGFNKGFFKNRITTAFSLGIRKDNLSNIESITTNRRIYNILTNIRFSKNWNANVVWNNFSQDLRTEVVNINNLFTYAVTNSNQIVNLSYKSSQKESSFSSTVSVGKNNFSTISDGAEMQSEYGALFLRYNGKYDLKNKKLGFLLGANFHDYKNIDVSNVNYGLTVGVTKRLLEDRLSIQAKSNYNLLLQDDFKEGSNLIFNVSGAYKLSEKASLQINLYRVTRNSEVFANFSEYRTRLAARYKF